MFLNKVEALRVKNAKKQLVLEQMRRFFGIFKMNFKYDLNYQY